MKTASGLQSLQEKYAIIDLTAENLHEISYIGTDNSNRNVSIKAYKTANLTSFEWVLFKHEYDMIKKLDCDGVIKVYDIADHNGMPSVIYEFIEGTSLRNIMDGGRIDLARTLNIVLQLASSLGVLHSSDIIHRDIRPSNIVIAGESAKLIDFGISVIFNRMIEKIYLPAVASEILPFISPEMTGRINRDVDYRSDLYSLGLTMYEMLTGVNPLKRDDPREVIYCHIARNPEPPHVINPDVPRVLSAIVMKLIAKNPEDRYQNSFGLHADIIRCINGLDGLGRIQPFAIASEDIASRFTMPQVFIGREKELETLLTAFAKVCSSFRQSGKSNGEGGVELVMVHGHPGIGKSTLIGEISRRIIEKNGYFISGKHDEIKRNVPYSSIIQAFQRLVRELLSESEDRIARWRDLLREALHDNGRVITDVIPDVELIIGKQPEVLDLGAEAAMNRLKLMFLGFIRALATADHPLVLFIDDFQWADYATMNLVKSILEDDEMHNLLMIISYRDNEPEKHLPQHEAVNYISNLDVSMHSIKVEPFGLDDTMRYVACFLRKDAIEARTLGELVYEKTRGNPFFINQFMKSIFDVNVLAYDPAGGWKCDFDAIRQMPVTSNVSHLMMRDIMTLPPETLRVLKICCCMGSRFELEIVADAAGISLQAVLAEMSPVIKGGYVTIAGTTFKFAHDRIVEMLYSLIPEDERWRTHYSIGNLILQRTSEDDLDDSIITIVSQLNAGLPCIVADEERYRVAKLNLAAAQKAMASAAYQSAHMYLKTAAGIVGDDCWNRDYDFALSLFTKGVEAAFLVTDFAYMDSLAKTVLANARDILDTIIIHERVIQMLYAQNRLREGLREGLQVLTNLGMPLPDNPTRLHILTALVKTRLMLKWKRIEDLENMKEMDDHKMLASVYIFNYLSVAIYKTKPRILQSLLFKALEVSLRHGNAPETAMSFAGYAMILCGALGDIDNGYAYGQLALALSERPGGKKHSARVLHLVKSMVWHWKNHVRESVESLTEAYHLQLEIGDIEQATSSANLFCLYSYLSGMPLDAVRQRMDYYYRVIRQFRQTTNFNYLAISYQAVLNLSGESGDPCCLQGEAYNEETMAPVHEAANDRSAIALVHIHGLIDNYLFHNFEEAMRHANAARENLDGLVGVFIVPVFYFYDSLAHLADCERASRMERRRRLAHVAGNQKKMLKWASHAPMNHRHKYYLVEAERLRVRGDAMGAMRHYTKAIEGAREHEFMQEEALAFELASRFHSAQGQDHVAGIYLREALRLYDAWDAAAKVRHMGAAYPQLASADTDSDRRQDARSSLARDQDGKKIDAAGARALDLVMVVNALQVISQEIELEKLIERVMRLAIENAGAHRGVLIMQRDDDLYVEAEGLMGDTPRILLKSEELKNYKAIPVSIVNYVKRTGTIVALNDAAHQGGYEHDPYIRENETRSVLCVPLIRQQVMKGIIYLENNTTIGVFSLERIEMVKLFSTQAAISLENAILFEKRHVAEKVLRESEEKYRLLIETMNDGVGIVDAGGVFTYANNTFCEMLRYPHDEIIGKKLDDLLDGENRILHDKQMDLRRQGKNRPYELNWIRKDGEVISTIVSPRAIFDARGGFAGSFGVVTDVTERKKLQEQLLQFQKMEAIGTLAGGIAHDFNNLLTTIIGYGGMLQKRIDPSDPQYEIVDEILQAANRSASLTRQLLAFSRKQMLQPVPLDLNSVITNMEKMLLRIIGEDITFHTDLDRRVKMVKADLGQIEQVIMNLVVNARDAMPSGGRLTIDSRNIMIESGDVGVPENVYPGEYACLSIRDNGVGIDSAIIKQIFEPFFSTKDAGVGTGLGLSVVYGIINQHKGWIDVASVPGTGTTFSIYLPVFHSKAEKAHDEVGETAARAADYRGMGQRILLVEDQADVRKFIITVLKESNYIVFPAARAGEAMELFEREKGKFDLVISDVVLPDISGLRLIEKLLAMNPGLAVILSSGYSDQKSEWERINDIGYVFLQKPYAAEKLVLTVHDVLRNSRR
ncbi:MAG: AAA family ATPase [Spirochaetes bacterium]|nr:AAA family ATPase [Spirochaetota bacterium]